MTLFVPRYFPWLGVLLAVSWSPRFCAAIRLASHEGIDATLGTQLANSQDATDGSSLLETGFDFSFEGLQDLAKDGLQKTAKVGFKAIAYGFIKPMALMLLQHSVKDEEVNPAALKSAMLDMDGMIDSFLNDDENHKEISESLSELSASDLTELPKTLALVSTQMAEQLGRAPTKKKLGFKTDDHE